MANGNGESKYKIEKIPGKKKDPPKKSTPGMGFEPRGKKTNPIGDIVKNVGGVIDHFQDKYSEEKKFQQQLKNDKYNELVKRNSHKLRYNFPMDKPQLTEEYKNKLKKEAKPPHSINQNMENFVNEKRRSKPKGMSEMEWMENKN